MFSLIFCLLLLFEQVKSFNGRNRELQNDVSKKMRSAESGTTSDHTNSFFLDSNRRGWQTFDSWENNEPQRMSCGSVAYSVTIENKTQQYLLMVTAYPNFLREYDKSKVFESWLYTVDTKSWQELDKFSPLPARPAMIQLCSKIIALEAVNTESFLNSNKAWILDTVLLQWQQTQLDCESLDGSRFSKQIAIPPNVRGVAIQQLQTNCRCKQSALVFLQPYVDDSHKTKPTMYEVRCVNRAGIESYEMKIVKSNISHISRFWSQLVCSCSNCIALYNPTTNILWKFENETWTNVSKIPGHLKLFPHVKFPKEQFGCAFTKETGRLIVFSIADKNVVKFDLKRKKYSIENVGRILPNRLYQRVMGTVAETSYKIVVFLSDILIGKMTAWTLIYQNKVWIWSISSAPNIAPSSRIEATSAFRDHFLTVWGGLDYYNIRGDTYQSWSGLVWTLDLTTMRWWLKIKGHFSDFIKYRDTCWMTNNCLVSLRHNNKLNEMEAWIYNVSATSWKLLVSTSLMNKRFGLSFVAANASTAISFGGKDFPSEKVIDETLILHLLPSVQWRRSLADKVNIVRPSARSNHAAVIMKTKMYVFGGINAAQQCLNDLWVFDINTERWEEVTPVNEPPDLSDVDHCLYFAASTPGQLLVTLILELLETNSGQDDDRALITWMFIVDLKMWHRIDYSLEKRNDRHKLTIEDVISKIVYWNGFLLMYDSYAVDIRYLAVKCPAGFTSSNISEKPCTFCKKGFYRETTFSDSNCFVCPNGLTTVNVGAHNITECSVCDDNFCKYGKCVPDFSERSLRPVCKCYIGYTGSTCQYPTYYLIVTGLILFVVVVSAGVTAYLFMLKRKTLNERALRREVVALTDAWQIDENEVACQEMIGSGASGSVYKAFYRDITVAVKKMVAIGLAKSIEDFETEIMFMRTVRHKNIVLFIGAGKSQPGDVPFLVMEYMERGSLKNVLYDLSIDIDYDRKLSFAMDSARGMHFLHTLEPPRIHRDLKSDNLLVSKHWIVKVADFVGHKRTVGHKKIVLCKKSQAGDVPFS